MTTAVRPKGRRRPQGLSPAERARTMVATAVDLRVELMASSHEVNRHAVTPDGSLLLFAPRDSTGVFEVAPMLPAGAVTISTVDVASVPQHDRVRGSLRLSGTLGPAADPLPAGVRNHLAGPDPAVLEDAGRVLKFQPTRAVLAWHCERLDSGGQPWRDIPMDDYRSAFPDPVMAYECQWLPHLQVDHLGVLRALAAQVYDDLDDSVDVRPLVLDRFGLVLRLYAEGAHLDLRLPFSRPVTCGCEIRDAFNALLDGTSPETPGFHC